MLFAIIKKPGAVREFKKRNGLGPYAIILFRLTQDGLTILKNMSCLKKS